MNDRFHIHKLTPEELELIKKAVSGVLGDDVEVEVEKRTVSSSEPDERDDGCVEKILKDLEDIEDRAIRLAGRAQDITGDCIDGTKQMSGGVNRILFGMAKHCFITLTDLARAIQHAAEFVRERERDD